MVSSAFDYSRFSPEQAARLRALASQIRKLPPEDHLTFSQQLELGRLLSEANEIIGTREEHHGED